MRRVHSLFILIATFGLSWGLTASAQSVSPAECLSRLGETLGFRADLAHRLSAETEVTYNLVERITRASFGVGPWNEGSCAPIAEQIQTQLYRFLSRRFERTLARGELEVFYHEYRITEAYHRRGRAVDHFTALFPTDLNQRYLETLRDRLFTLLQPSPWNPYSVLSFSIDQWSEEWRVSLGADANAAIDLDHSRVALNPFALPPEELEYFLFHELAHLSHWGEKPASPSFAALAENERVAWEETARFVDWRTGQGHVVPSSVLGIRATISRIGTRNWSNAALRSRGLR